MFIEYNYRTMKRQYSSLRFKYFQDYAIVNKKGAVS